MVFGEFLHFFDFSMRFGKGFWTVLTVLDTFGPTGHHGPDMLTGVAQTLNQSPWKMLKIVVFFMKIVENVTFSSVRFVGDIFDKIDKK